MNRFVRLITAAAVLFVAAVAGVVSFSHIYDLGVTHGQSGVAARLLPLSVDGLIVCSGLVLLHEARSGRPAIWQARLGLWSGIAATVTANVLYGARFGLLGAALSGWPAYAFIIAAETMMVQVRRYGTGMPAVAAPDAAMPASPAGDTGREAGGTPGPVPDTIPAPSAGGSGTASADACPKASGEAHVPVPGAVLPEVPSSAEHAAELAFRATHAAGNPLSLRRLTTRFGLTRAQASKVRQRVLAELGDGQGAEPDPAPRRLTAWPGKELPPEPVAAVNGHRFEETEEVTG